jgi:hypothetical protein
MRRIFGVRGEEKRLNRKNCRYRRFPTARIKATGLVFCGPHQGSWSCPSPRLPQLHHRRYCSGLCRWQDHHPSCRPLPAVGGTPLNLVGDFGQTRGFLQIDVCQWKTLASTAVHCRVDYNDGEIANTPDADFMCLLGVEQDLPLLGGAPAQEA